MPSKAVSGLLNTCLYWSKCQEEEALSLTIWKHFHSFLNDSFSSPCPILLFKMPKASKHALASMLNIKA